MSNYTASHGRDRINAALNVARTPHTACLALFALLLAGPTASAEDKVFDAKGFDPNRQYMRELPFEHIDPLTGNVLLTFTDLVLPGNAGFDLKIQRTYNSKIYKTLSNVSGFTLGEDSWAGLGWSLHMGRLIFASGGSPFPGCTSCPIAIELPDGRRSAFSRHLDGVATHLMTKEFWTYEHGTSSPPTHRLRLPNGVVYRFTENVASPEPPQVRVPLDGDATLQALYVSQIEDPFGNKVKVFHRTGTLAHLIERIEQYLVVGSSVPSRVVTFGYTPLIGGVTANSLASMTYNPAGRPPIVWTYTQSRPAGLSVGWTTLDAVQPPEGPAWSFDYHVAPSSTAQWTLSRVTTPNGGTVTYAHQRQVFQVGSGVIYSPAVSTRTVGGRLPSGGSGVWTWSYNSSVADNVTTIASPCGPRTIHRFLGISSGQPHAWKLGALESRTVESGASVWEREVFTWAPSPLISTDDEGLPGSGTRVPLLQRRAIERPGDATYVTDHTYDLAAWSAGRAANFANYGRPHLTTESGQLSRTIQRTFFYFPTNAYPGFTNYIVDKVDTERLNPSTEDFTTDYDYLTAGGYKGFVAAQTVNGITTTFAPDPAGTGNPASATDDNGHKTSFTYQWGVLKDTTTPLYAINRLILPEGLVGAETRRGFTTGFEYDRLMRRTRISPTTSVSPPSSPTNITYDAQGEFIRTTRGASSHTQSIDGFGRLTDTLDAVNVRTHLRYDSCGRRIYESYPFEGALNSPSDVGSSYQLDPLDRVTRRTNPDGSFARYVYGGALANGIDLVITDEQGRSTSQDWSAFGDPRDARLMGVTGALSDTTTYAYNGLGSLLRATPAGTPSAERTWEYYGPAESSGAHGQLKRERHPESGTVSYTYYRDGRMETRTDGLGTTRFSHDANHRLLSADRPGSVDDTSMIWDQSDNRTSLRNGDVNSSFAFDPVNRLRTRQDVVGGHTLRTSYLPDASDNIARIDYASGTRSQYSYDAENRVTRVTDGGARTFADTFQYHPSGAISSYRAGNGLVHTTSYDPQRYWVTAIDAGGHLRVDYDQHDLVGNVTHMNTLGPALGAQTFVYDALDRLRTVSGSWGQSSYTYDLLGNRLSKQIGSASTSYTYDAATQRLTSASGAEPGAFSYDANGNTVGDSSATYTYTPANMLASSSALSVTTSYRYDGDDLRKAKITGATSRFFTHDTRNQLLSEFEQVGTGPLLAVRDYVYAGSRLIASVRPPVLAVSPQALTFSAVTNGSAPSNQTLAISAAGASLAWTASESASWLSLLPTSGSTTPATVSVSVSPAGLPVGTHVAAITIDAPGALGSPRQILVRFVVTSEPALAVQPADLRFTMVDADPNAPSQALDIVYSGSGSAAWSATGSESWIGLSTTSGTTPSQVAVSVDGSGFEPGTYRGYVTVTSPGTAGSPRFVPVELVVQAAAGATCASDSWYCEPFDGLADGDLAGQGGWDSPPAGAVSPQVGPDPRGVGKTMVLDPPPGEQANSLRTVLDQPLARPGIEISMQVMATDVPADTRQIAKIEFFTQPGIAWGKTTRTFGALRFGGTLYLQYGPNIYQVLVEHMEAGRFYDVRVEYGRGMIDAYVDGVHRFSTPNPLPVKNPPMQAFGLTGWDFPGTAYIDLIQGRSRSTGLLVEPLTLDFQSSSGNPVTGGEQPAQDTDTASIEAATRPRMGDAAGTPAVRLDGLSDNLPLGFEANQGQTASDVRFLARGKGHTLFLTPREVVMTLASRDAAPASTDRPHDRTNPVLRMRLAGANPSPEMEGRGELPGRVNYYVGNDPALWRTGVRRYAQVAYREVYPGVDMIFHGRQRQLEYDLVVAPHADASLIRLAFEGAEATRVDAQGDLVLKTATGEVRQRKPLVYQELEGRQVPIEGRYQLVAGGEVGFALAAYDRSQALVIDPVLSLSTYLGGEGEEAAAALAVDEDQNVYATGITTSLDFPTVGATQSTRAGTVDAYVTKFTADGSSLVYSTYLGGPAGLSGGIALALDPSGAAYVAGETSSAAFPLLGALQGTYGGGGKDGLVTKLDPSGALVYSTYLGGSGFDLASGIAIDGLGNAHVTGRAGSNGFVGRTPRRVNLDVPAGSATEVFVVKVQPNGADLDHFTYLNGNQDDIEGGIAVDRDGNTYVTGATWSTPHPDRARNPFPAYVGAFQSTNTTAGDVFVTKLSPAGALRYSTYVGGGLGEKGWDVALDPSCGANCTAHVSGHTQSVNFPTTQAAAWTTHNGVVAGFVLGMNATGSALVYSTFLGPGQVSQYHGVTLALDGDGHPYVFAGQANISQFPASLCTTAVNFGTQDVGPLLVKVEPDGRGLGYCAGFGAGVGFTDSIGYAVAVDPLGAAFVSGQTKSPDFPTTADAYDRTLGGPSDGFVARVAEAEGTLARFRFASAAQSASEHQGSAVVLVTRTGDLTTTATVDYATSDGTAAAPGDYTTTAGTLTFAPGEAARTFSVPIVNDGGAEPDETVNLRLSSPSGGPTLGFPSAATLTILDDDNIVRTFKIRDRVLPTGPNWTASVDVPWLSLSAYSGSGPSTVTATISAAPDLPPGVYEGHILVTGDTGNSPQFVDVTWTITE